VTNARSALGGGMEMTGTGSSWTVTAERQAKARISCLGSYKNRFPIYPAEVLRELWGKPD